MTTMMTTMTRIMTTTTDRPPRWAERDLIMAGKRGEGLVCRSNGSHRWIEGYLSLNQEKKKKTVRIVCSIHHKKQNKTKGGPLFCLL